MIAGEAEAEPTSKNLINPSISSFDLKLFPTMPVLETSSIDQFLNRSQMQNRETTKRKVSKIKGNAS